MSKILWEGCKMREIYSYNIKDEGETLDHNQHQAREFQVILGSELSPEDLFNLLEDVLDNTMRGATNA